MNKAGKLPPGPPGKFFIGRFPMAGADPLALLTGWARRYGDVYHYRAFGIHVCVLSHPDYIESVLVRRPQDFVKGRGLQVNRRLFGKGLLTSEGEAWKTQRQLCQPSFSGERINEYGDLMTACASQMLDAWRDGEIRSLDRDLAVLTLKIVTRTLFGVDAGALADEVQRNLKPVMEFNTRGRILLPAMRYLPTPASVRYRLAARRLDQVVDAIIRQRRASSHDGDDLLALLLRTHDDGAEMPASLLRDEVMTLLLAGHETTALALCWAIYLIAQNPIIENALVEETARVLGHRPPGVQDLASLPRATNVIKETLRLYPPAYAMVRIAARDIELGEYVVPRGASVILSQWIVHRDPRFYAEPERFNPDRWTTGFASHLPRFAYFPFGGGPRACIGASFALTEAALVLVTVLQKFHLELALEGPLLPVPGITLRPRDALRVRVRRR